LWPPFEAASSAIDAACVRAVHQCAARLEALVVAGGGGGVLVWFSEPKPKPPKPEPAPAVPLPPWAETLLKFVAKVR
jgi:hypothetical protein